MVRTSGNPYISTSYRFKAPLDEYENLNQPKWGCPKQLPKVLQSVKKVFLKNSLMNKDSEIRLMSSTYVDSSSENSISFLCSEDTTKDGNIKMQKKGKQFVPTFSFCLLFGCYKDVYDIA